MAISTAPVFVTGGSGFVGTAVIEELLTREHTVIALTNRQPLKASGARLHSVKGSLFDAAALREGMRGCGAVIHLVGIIMERPVLGVTFERIHFRGAANVIDAAKAAGVKRFVHMSALGARSGAVSEYHQTKYKAEEYLRQSGLDWTILRPSLIHGPRGEFMQMEVKWARKQAPPFLFMPYFGAGLLGRGGAGQLAPVFVQDVARALVDALEKPQTAGEVYPLGGPAAVTWPRLHETVANAVTGHNRWVMAVPVWYAKLLTSVLPGFMLPFNRDQVVMSQEDNTCDLSKLVDHFGWTPEAFEPALKKYIGQM